MCTTEPWMMLFASNEADVGKVRQGGDECIAAFFVHKQNGGRTFSSLLLQLALMRSDALP